MTQPYFLLRDEVYQQLQDWIVTGALEPGTKLRDVDLAERLGVSRTPVREALRRLHDEGLVETAAARWTRVAPLDRSEADRIYPLLASLERLAVTDSSPFFAEEIDALEAANVALAQALDDNDGVAASEADHRFHQVIVDHAANPELTRIVRDLKVRLRRLEVAYFGGTATAQRSVHEHSAVIERLRAADYPGAARAIEHNWRASLSRVREPAIGGRKAELQERSA